MLTSILIGGLIVSIIITIVVDVISNNKCNKLLETTKNEKSNVVDGVQKLSDEFKNLSTVVYKLQNKILDGDSIKIDITSDVSDELEGIKEELTDYQENFERILKNISDLSSELSDLVNNINNDVSKLDKDDIENVLLEIFDNLNYQELAKNISNNMEVIKIVNTEKEKIA